MTATNKEVCSFPKLITRHATTERIKQTHTHTHEVWAQTDFPPFHQRPKAPNARGHPANARGQPKGVAHNMHNNHSSAPNDALKTAARRPTILKTAQITTARRLNII